MTSDRATLLELIADVLDQARVPYAVIGAAALAVHGVSRSTVDIDLLATDLRLLQRTFWNALSEMVEVDIRTGDSDDPLAGVARFRSSGERDVDIVIGRSGWQADILARAQPVRRGGRGLPTVLAEDLILLKLYAGGSQDRWDIEQLLRQPEHEGLAARVADRLSILPAAARELWKALIVGGST